MHPFEIILITVQPAKSLTCVNQAATTLTERRIAAEARH
jgi:hypothetical protein